MFITLSGTFEKNLFPSEGFLLYLYNMQKNEKKKKRLVFFVKKKSKWLFSAFLALVWISALFPGYQIILHSTVGLVIFRFFKLH